MTIMKNPDASPLILKSKDGRIVIEVVKDSVLNSQFPQCDFSFVEVPPDYVESKQMFGRLHSSQRNSHVMMCTVRQPRKTRLSVFANLLAAEEAGFRFHDMITLFSQEPYKGIPSNLTPLGEVTCLFTKGNEINKAATQWFREDVGDCSNVWDVTPQEGELENVTVSRHFCLEQGFLTANCASPLICRRFLVLSVPETGHVEFAFKAKLNMHCITVDEISARRVIRYYHAKLL